MDWEQTREEFLKRNIGWQPDEPEQPKSFKHYVPGYESFEEEMWERRHEFRSRLTPEDRYPVKTTLDQLGKAIKLVDVLLSYDKLSPEAMGFTSRKIANLIKSLEQLKAKLDGRLESEHTS